MQLPGMKTEPIRVSLELTWWPGDGTYDLARREWARDEDGNWQILGIATSGTPLRHYEAIRRLQTAFDNLARELRERTGPFDEGEPF